MRKPDWLAYHAPNHEDAVVKSLAAVPMWCQPEAAFALRHYGCCATAQWMVPIMLARSCSLAQVHMLLLVFYHCGVSSHAPAEWRMHHVCCVIVCSD
jgi:hypothetical protein